MFLTKNDFIVARTCPTKLYYKKLRYPSLLDDDPYLEFLADGGYMVEAMAKQLFLGGREIGHWEEPMRAFEETRQAVDAGDGTCFEATVIHDNLLARVDILQREGTTLRVIEVKSSSFDSEKDGPNPFRGKKGGILSDWRDYLEDVTFQVVVLRRAFPEYEVAPLLCLVDKAKQATENATFDKFRLHRIEGQLRPRVDYLGDVNRLQNEHVLAFLGVASEVEELETEVSTAADELAATLQTDPITRVDPEIGQKCKNCEYRVLGEEGERNGFRECWGGLAGTEPHVLDLYRVDILGGKKRDIVAEMAAAGKAGLGDVPDDCLQGVVAERQKVQINFTKERREYKSKELPRILASHPHPLHFIDFEGSRIGIPYHAGMHSYEQASFQWSCHTSSADGAEVTHNEWINADEVFPSFEFARTLKDEIGDEGTVYVWSHYEVTVLREIRRQLEKYAANDADLAGWLDRITAPKNPRIVDLCDLAKDHYFHPVMKGSLSIKYAVRAAWGENEILRTNPLFVEYVKYDDHGRLLDPYMALPPLPIGEKEEVVREGTGAMRVYQEMMFGKAKEDQDLCRTYRELLLSYCKLDTLAMVFLWMHWHSGQRI
jgi:Domain of unknown function(DUF2779)